MTMRNVLLLVALAFVALAAAGCQSVPTGPEPLPPEREVYVPPEPEPPAPPPEPAPEPEPEPEPLVKAIPAKPRLLHGRLEVPIGRRWSHIVIHHSAGPSGNMAIFDRAHKQRGWDGVGYHFVIGNGRGLPDGAIEATFRWERQMHGAHAGVNEYNQHGIGICLVGNFSESVPTERQIESLVSLVTYLQARCQVPGTEIVGHRHVKQTECPGQNFPYYEVLALCRP
jgi:N-acetyl-anhydromuramyl-L-alanine amidase AmpD